jgi:hypothetical protein
VGVVDVPDVDMRLLWSASRRVGVGLRKGAARLIEMQPEVLCDLGFL